MQIHGLGHVHGPHPVSSPHRSQATPAAPPTDTWSGVDQLDISPETEMIGRVQDLPEIRADRVAEIRAQIAEGTYETEAKLDAAVGRLLDELAG